MTHNISTVLNFLETFKKDFSEDTELIGRTLFMADYRTKDTHASIQVTRFFSPVDKEYSYDFFTLAINVCDTMYTNIFHWGDIELAKTMINRKLGVLKFSQIVDGWCEYDQFRHFDTDNIIAYMESIFEMFKYNGLCDTVKYDFGENTSDDGEELLIFNIQLKYYEEFEFTFSKKYLEFGVLPAPLIRFREHDEAEYNAYRLNYSSRIDEYAIDLIQILQNLLFTIEGESNQ